MARATYVPITPEVLEWAMVEAGAEPPDVAERAGVEVDRVLGWLSGDEQPTKTQFGRLPDYFKRPAAFFFLPRPPQSEAVPASFRHPPGGARDATRAELDAIRTARRVQKVAAWTAERVEDTRWSDNPIPAANGMAPAAAAHVASEWLAWSTKTQQQAPSASAVVRLLRQKLEERGVLALQLSIGEEGCRGFSFFDDDKPLVAVNTHYNPEARLYSYLHEVGHLMRRTDAICIGYASTVAERWCERFAAAFLLPADPLRQRLEYRFGDRTISDLDDVRALARDFRVSLSATAIRLEDLGWGRAGLFQSIPRTSDFKSGGGGPGTDNTRGAVRLRELGEGYFSLLLAGERAGVLGRQDVLRYLDVSDAQLRGLASDGVGQH
jgi:Zn-dependent peptidase ImmA (M78 family)